MARKDRMEIDKIVKTVIEELQNRGLIQDKRHNSYSNTELLLYNYNNLQKSIQENDLEIKELQEFGLPKKSGSIITIEGISTNNAENDLVLIEERVNDLLQTNARTTAIINKIDRLIRVFENPKYPGLIENLYFKHKTYEECAEIYNCDIATVSRNKKLLVDNIKSTLFPNDILDELSL